MGPPGPPGTVGLNSVGSAQVIDGSLVGGDLAPFAIGGGQIQNSAIGRVKLGPDVPLPQGYAAVSSDGSLLRGLNVTSVSHTGTGTYVVAFNSAVNVSQGILMLTPGLNGTCATQPSAERSTGNSVFTLFASGSTRIDCGFSLVVF